MKKSNIFVLLASLLVTPVITNAQVKLPPASSNQTIVQGLGITKATLTYNRPSMNERQIFGGLVPLNEVWRTGANNIPVLTLEGDIYMAGHAVPAGTYGVLTIPKNGEWTVILSKNSKQWGSYTYNQEEDFVRFNIYPEMLTTPVETFTMGFADVTPVSASLCLSWEHVKIRIPITFDQDEEIMASIEAGMSGTGNKPYLQAAQYYYNNDKDINKAVEWINAAHQANPEAVHIYLWKARIQLKAGDRSNAITTAKVGLERAKEANNGEYIKLMSEILAEAQG